MTSLSFIASAPASAMLMGEHAVLFGHSALVCALTQRIFVKASKRADGQIVITSSLGYFECAVNELAMQVERTSSFAFVLQALTLSGQVETGGVELVIESEFEHTLGLGSSAAVTVACMGAMALLANGRFDAQEAMQTSIESIRKVQGRGSGADVAASALGGIVKFQGNPLRTKKTLFSLAALQDAPHLLLVYCGYKTLTSLVIAQVAEAAEQEPQRFAQLYEQMGACVETSEKALEREDWWAFAQSMNQYQILMRALGVSDESTETIIRLAQKKSPLDTLLGAKISGSGLGDCVLLLGSEALDWPHTQISVQIEPQGLRQEMQLPKALQREKQL